MASRRLGVRPSYQLQLPLASGRKPFAETGRPTSCADFGEPPSAPAPGALGERRRLLLASQGARSGAIPERVPCLPRARGITPASHPHKKKEGGRFPPRPLLYCLVL